MSASQSGRGSNNRRGQRLLIHVWFLGLSALFSGCLGRDDRPDAAAQLLQSFQNSCVTRGRWTDVALAQSSALVETLESLRRSDRCAPYRGALVAMNAMSQQISGLLEDPDFRDYRLAEENLQTLTQNLIDAGFLSAAGGPVGPADSNAYLSLSAVIGAHTELALAKARARTSSQYAGRDRYAVSTERLGQAVQMMLSEANGLSECLKSSPSAAIGLASSLLALGGSFVSPVLGAGTAVVGTLVSIGVEAARQSTDLDDLWRAYSVQVPTALSCGFESMTELYCAANDAEDLLRLHAEGYSSPGREPNRTWVGLDLLGRQLPVLYRWLTRVKNGAPPADAYDADRQNSSWRLVQKLDNTAREVAALLQMTQNRMRDAGDADKKKDIIKTLIRDLSYTLVPPDGGGGGGRGPNPFLLITNESPKMACYLIRGRMGQCPETQGMFDSVDAYLSRNDLLNPLPDLGVIQSNWEGIFRQADALVQVEFAQNISTDPEATLEAAKRRLDVAALPPRAVLGRLLRFLDQMLAEEGNDPSFRTLLEETQGTLRRVAGWIDHPASACGNDDPLSNDPLRIFGRPSGEEECFRSPSQTALIRIFVELDLRRGLSSIQTRLSSLVEWDIQRSVEQGRVPRDAREILRVLGGEISERFLASGSPNRALVFQDLNKARSITQANLAVFRRAFSPLLERSIRSLHRQRRMAREPGSGRPGRSNGEVLAELCLFAAMTGDRWPAGIPIAFCRGSVLSGAYSDPSGGLSLEFDDFWAEAPRKPYREKFCAFHRYLRSNRIAEIMDGYRRQQAEQDLASLMKKLAF